MTSFSCLTNRNSQVCEKTVTSPPPWVRGDALARAEKLQNLAMDRGTNSHAYAGRIYGVTNELDRPWVMLNPNETLGQLNAAIEKVAGREDHHAFDETQPIAFHVGQEFRFTLNGIEHFATIRRHYTAYCRHRYRVQINGLELAITQAQLSRLTGIYLNDPPPRDVANLIKFAPPPKPFHNVRVNLMAYNTKPWCEPHQPDTTRQPAVVAMPPIGTGVRFAASETQPAAKPELPAWINGMLNTVRFLNGTQQHPRPAGEPDTNTVSLIKYLNRNCPNQKTGAEPTGFKSAA